MSAPRGEGGASCPRRKSRARLDRRREVDNLRVLHVYLPGKSLWFVVCLVVVLVVVPACSAVCEFECAGRSGAIWKHFFQWSGSSLLVVT